jgi:hypothetical protein
MKSKTTAQIAKEYGITPNKVRNIVDNLKMQPTKIKGVWHYTASQEDKILEQLGIYKSEIL